MIATAIGATPAGLGTDCRMPLDCAKTGPDATGAANLQVARGLETDLQRL